jgi:tRNA nucleotidyltransferase (CCA-adding enzyme)
MPTVPLERVLPTADLTMLRSLGAAANAVGARLWLVGGSVRDALLDRPVTDLDLTSAANASEIAPVLTKAVAGTVAARSHFGTVKLHVGNRTLDLATLRSERYERPGSLPTVGPGDVQSDLARRDISINAMAMSLAPEDFGELLDTEGGLADLREGRIRILHEQSFQDDATRVLRALRYETRLGFAMDRRTATLLQRDLAYLGTISPARVRREIERTLDEPLGARMLSAEWTRGVLAAIHPALGDTAVGDALHRATRAQLAPLALLGALVYASPMDGSTAMSSRLALTRGQAGIVAHTQRIAGLESQIAGARPAAVHELVVSAPDDAIRASAVGATDPAARASLARYLARVAAVGQVLDGNDLKSLGVPEGPEMGRLLDELQALSLDGAIRSRGSAVAHVNRALAAKMTRTRKKGTAGKA